MNIFYYTHKKKEKKKEAKYKKKELMFAQSEFQPKYFFRVDTNVLFFKIKICMFILFIIIF